MCEYCQICGARISENNIDGIGYECRKALSLAKSKIFWANSENKLNLYIIEVTLIKDKFLEVFATTKFRSEFKKSFFASMQNAQRVSRKQVEIMKKELFYKIDLSIIIHKVKVAQANYIAATIAAIVVDRQLIEIARQEIRKNSN